MVDFHRTTNDWDLEAIIRGGGGASAGSPPPAAGCQLSPLLGFDGFGFGFELESSEGVIGAVNELEELYKPFVVVDQQPKHESPRSSMTETTTNSPCSSSFVVFDHDDDVEKPKEEMKMPLDLDLVEEDHTLARSSSKRRKSKHKIVRVVHRGVAEDGVLMDKWNWRKYGQKAIKGSPHPRSYYRCSSSGGCQARKHVEQSKDNPDTCIVTYIADHTHSPPTRRHAQAGRKITKFSTSATRVIKNNTTKTSPCSTSMTWAVSDPSIVEDGDQVALGGGSHKGFVEVEEDESCGLGVLKDLFSTSSTSFDHDYWNILEFDSFFSTSVN